MSRNYRKQCGRGVLAVGAMVFTLLMGGCDSGAAGPETWPVTGKVTLNGQPVAEAMVTFLAQGEGKSATAYSGQDGTFSVQTYFDNGKQSKSGMVPGTYSVTVTKLDPSPAASPGTPPKNFLPEKYATAANSGLVCTVTADGPNECNLEL